MAASILSLVDMVYDEVRAMFLYLSLSMNNYLWIYFIYVKANFVRYLAGLKLSTSVCQMGEQVWL